MTRYSDDPLVAGGIRADERLLASARRDGYRVLTVHHGRTVQAVRRLTGHRIGAQPVSVTELFLESMHALVPRARSRRGTHC